MHTPQQNQDTFHNLPETFNKNSLKAYVPKEQSFTKLNFLKKIFLKFYLPKELSLAMVSHVFELDFVKDGLKQQFLTQIGEKPAKNKDFGYTLKQMLAYIHREMGKIQIETDNDKQYGLAFDLSNNLGIRITYHKNKKYIYKYIYKNDILKMIKIIDSYNIPKLNGNYILHIHGFDFLNDTNIEYSQYIQTSHNMELITTLKTGVEDISNFPIIQAEKSDNFQQRYKKELKKLENKYQNMLSIGGKIHFEKSIPEEKIEEFKKHFGFSSTPFQLIHANTSLLLPPSYFPEELALIIGFFQKYGLIQGNPELQLSIPSRLPNRAAAMLGSCMLLSSTIHIEYPPEAFKTTHNTTGNKIMAYDGGVLEQDFKGIPKYIKLGRTDMLGIQDITIIPLYHLVGTLLCHGIFQGTFQKYGILFMNEYKNLLGKHHLQHILEKEWIYISKEDNKEAIDKAGQEHYEMIKEITDRQKNDWDIYNTSGNKNGLLVFEIEKLLKKYQNLVYYHKGFLSSIQSICAKITDTLVQTEELS